MELVPIQAGGYAMKRKYPALIRQLMSDTRVSKTTLLRAGIIKRSTWKRFDEKLDDGSISAAELFAIVDYLQIEPVKAAITFTSFTDVAEYFEPTTECGSRMGIEMAISLTQKMAVLEGNFDSMKQAACKVFADKQSAFLVERNQRLHAERLGRDLQCGS
jgi:hypothetical protein